MWKFLSALTAVCLAVLSCPADLIAQAPERVTSADIHHGIRKLGVLASALYVAAHPDDENTRMISFLANHECAHTTYLSMTRGDGGQNLIGPEMRELLGLIRTNELLMARSLDGGNQMFTRANDFGYSKTPDETLEFWDKDEVLSDVVWAIRKHQPDVIITRFPHEHLNGNHGHHTASAMLAFEAFDLAGDPDVYPEQLKYVDTWQPERLFFNTFWWFYGSREKFDELDKSNMAQIDVGVFYPQSGLSNPEIAAMSRSMHKSQGFGSSGSRESMVEYLDLNKGSLPPDPADVFSGIDITWSRVDGGSAIQQMVHDLERSFDHERPYLSVPGLLKLRDAIAALSPSFWTSRKLVEVDDLIIDCTGLFTEVTADGFWGSPGDSIDIQTEVTNRSPQKINLVSVAFMGHQLLDNPVECPENTITGPAGRVKIPEDLEYTTPYWLREPGTEGMYKVDDQRMRGLPVAPLKLGVTFGLEIEGRRIEIFRPVVYKRTDPVDGEVYHPYGVVPPAFINIDESVYMFGDKVPKDIPVRVKTARDNVSGSVRLEVPAGWKVEPAMAEIHIPLKDGEETVVFQLTPPDGESVDTMHATLSIDGVDYGLAFTEIEYDHIPHLTVLGPANARIVKMDLKKSGHRIGYVMGAGDDIPKSLEQVGYSVDILDEALISRDLLDTYDAVILGVRAYNTSDRLKFYQDMLFDYAAGGGTLIMQYNTSRGLKVDRLAPLELELSRTRVSDETAPVEFLSPEHPVLNFPNAITSADFDNWVQERGLYFPGSWSDGFTPVLGMNDPGEDRADGSLLVAEYEDGFIIYTSLSMFRELPAGVPGAFRLFTNMISLGNPSKS